MDPAVTASEKLTGASPAAARTAFTAVRSSVMCTAFIIVDPVAIGSSVNRIVVAISKLLNGPRICESPAFTRYRYVVFGDTAPSLREVVGISVRSWNGPLLELRYT